MTPQYVTVIMPKYDPANEIRVIQTYADVEAIVKSFSETILNKLENEKRNAPNASN